MRKNDNNVCSELLTVHACHTLTRQVLFIRVMLIGNAAAGKTSLLRCLSDKDMTLKSLLRQPRLPDTGGATLGIQVGFRVPREFRPSRHGWCHPWNTGRASLWRKVAQLFVLEIVGMSLSEKILRVCEACFVAKTLALNLNRLHQVEKLEKSVRVCDAVVRLQFWDFAGQACYMVGHSLFLSDRVLPVYVFDAMNDTLDVIEQANRWLDSVVLSTSSSSSSSSPSGVPMQSSPPGSSQPANACPLVLVGTRVEGGKVSREACADKMESLEEALSERVAKLYGRTLVVRGKFGVSSSTRECYDCRMRGSRQAFSFSSLLSKIGQSALGVLYTDREYPRALVPVSYVRMREALMSMPESRPVIEMSDLAELGRRHAGITQREHLVRALAMLRSWGAFMHFCDSEALAGRAFQMQWCIELIYTLFVCAHWRTEGEEGRVSMEGLRGKVDVEGLELADPGGRLLRRGVLSGRAARVMFGRVASTAGLDDTDVCLEVLGSMGIVYSCGGGKGLAGQVGEGEGEGEEGVGGTVEEEEGVYLVPSLFNNVMPMELKASLRAGKMAWTTQREYRFNILPLKLASLLTVKLCAAADLRSGETSVSFWEDGAWVQMSDGAAVMIDSHQGGRLLIISTIQPPSRPPPTQQAAAGAAAMSGGMADGGQEGNPGTMWEVRMQGMIEGLVAQYKGVKVQCWLRCPHKGCTETLAYAALEPSCGGGWETIGKMWSGGGTAMCGAVPVAHTFPTHVWVRGQLGVPKGPGGGGGDAEAGVEEYVTRGAASARGNGGDRASTALVAVAGHGVNGYVDRWKTSQVMHYGEYAAHNIETFSGFLVDPYTHKVSEENMAVLAAVGACFGGDEQVVGGILMEVDDWAPVCKGVLGLLGSVIVAVERGKSNEGNRKRFYTRLVALGRSLLDVRRVFVHAPPPQMDALLDTLKSALSFITTFDQRSWLMRALRSGSDKALFDDLDRRLSQLCTDMSISLHATAYNDEHEALREVVDKLGGLERLQGNPELLGRLENLCEAQRIQGAQQQQQLSAIQLLLEREVQRSNQTGPNTQIEAHNLPILGAAVVPPKEEVGTISRSGDDLTAAPPIAVVQGDVSEGGEDTATAPRRPSTGDRISPEPLHRVVGVGEVDDGEADEGPCKEISGDSNPGAAKSASHCDHSLGLDSNVAPADLEAPVPGEIESCTAFIANYVVEEVDSDSD